MPPPGPDTPFEIGLVMAGAISAGAYTAGVIDCFIQALDAWYAAKAAGVADCPPHEVKLKVLTGASAGGMTAGLTAGLLCERFGHVTAAMPDGATNNRLYESWVKSIDITALLGAEDMSDTKRPLPSVLDSSVIRTIANHAFDYEDSSPPPPRPYLADPLRVLLTVSNLRGVPYRITFENGQSIGYEMMLHADYMDFALGSQADSAPPSVVRLAPRGYRDEQTAGPWRKLAEAAVATGAFPIGLAPEQLDRKATDYLHRLAVMPSFPPELMEYQFESVDGGVMDNEPIELARQILAWEEPHPERRAVLERQPHLATRAVVLIMPFPRDKPFPPQDPLNQYPSLFRVGGRTFSSLIAQARFKADELERAADPGVYSQFLITPARYNEQGQRQEYAIASGSVEGFGGFLSRAFRAHDYQLGRRNCQYFLARYFALPSEGPKTNPLFQNWSLAARQLYQIVRMPDGNHRPKGQPPQPGDQVLLPIIPLVGDAATPVENPPWPSYSPDSFEALRKMVEARLQLVVQRLIDENVVGWVTRRLLSNALWIKRSEVVNRIMVEWIGPDLRMRELM